MQRLKWPMQLVDGSLATVEQDSDEDIVQCVKSILKHRPGDRADIPQMGVPDLTFAEQPLQLDAVQEVVRRHEPRVDVLMLQDQTTIERLVAEVRAEWSRKEEADA